MTKIDLRYASNDAIFKRIETCEGYLHSAYEYVEKRVISYEAINLLLSTASKFAVGVATREHLAKTRKLASMGVKKDNSLNRKRDSLKKKGLSGKELKAELKKFKFSFRDELRSGIHKTLGELLEEKSKYRGELYEDLSDKYDVDLSRHDLESGSVILARGSVTLTTDKQIDMNKVLRERPETKLKKLDGNYYILEDALLLGVDASALPNKYNSETLSKLSNIKRLPGAPVPKMMRHKSSKRFYFLVPEFSMSINTVFFADRQSNKETQLITNLVDQCVDRPSVAMVLRDLNCSESEIELHLSSIFRSDNPIMKKTSGDTLSKSTLTIILNNLSHRVTSESLRSKREKFNMENKELIRSIAITQDDLASVQELSKMAKDEFSRLTSPTAEPETGLKISEYRYLNRVFSTLKRSALLNRDSTTPTDILIESLHKDKMMARLSYYVYRELRDQYSQLKSALNAYKDSLEVNRKLANNETVPLD